MTTYNPNTLPKNDNLSRFAYVIEVNQEIFVRTGKMIAYYGQLKFEALGSSILDMIVKNAFNAPLYINDFIVAKGFGQLILGDNGHDIASYDLDNANMTVKANNLLGFTKNLVCQESTLPGYLTLLGTGTVLASSNGPVHFLDLPCKVDQDAILGWADCPSPSFRYDYHYIKNVLTSVGGLTGILLSAEEKQIEFRGQGTVLVQSSEQEIENSTLLNRFISQLTAFSEHELGRLNQSIADEKARRKQSHS